MGVFLETEKEKGIDGAKHLRKMPLGYGTIDCGATGTVGGRDTLEVLEERNSGEDDERNKRALRTHDGKQEEWPYRPGTRPEARREVTKARVGRNFYPARSGDPHAGAPDTGDQARSHTTRQRSGPRPGAQRRR